MSVALTSFVATSRTADACGLCCAVDMRGCTVDALEMGEDDLITTSFEIFSVQLTSHQQRCSMINVTAWVMLTVSTLLWSPSVHAMCELSMGSTVPCPVEG